MTFDLLVAFWDDMAKVLKMLAFKLGLWSFALKANFGHYADTHSQFCQKSAILGHGIPVHCKMCKFEEKFKV